LLPLTIVQSAADAARIKGARSRLAATGGKTPISRLGESFAPNTGARTRATMTGLLNAAKEVRQHGTFSYIDASLATPEMNAFLRE
jgi:hypothetical protein